MKKGYGFIKPLYEQYSKLIKKATSFKSSDLKNSVKLIQDALFIYENLEGYFKLAQYLALDKQFDSAFSVLTKLLAEQDPKDLYMFNMHVARIEYEMAKVCYKQKMTERYFYYRFRSSLDEQIAQACQGRFEGAGSHHAKVDRNGSSLLKGNVTGLKADDISEQLEAFMASFYAQLKALSLQSEKVTSNRAKEYEYWDSNSVGERNSKLLGLDDTFIAKYANLKDHDRFKDFMDTEISPLLNQKK